MPARARASGRLRVMSRPSNAILPPRGWSSPMMLLSSVALPTPLRPIRLTTSPGRTSISRSRRISVSPYDTDRFSMVNIGGFFFGLAVLAQVNFDNLWVPLDFADGPLAEDHPLVQHGYLHGNLADEH